MDLSCVVWHASSPSRFHLNTSIGLSKKDLGILDFVRHVPLKVATASNFQIPDHQLYINRREE